MPQDLAPSGEDDVDAGMLSVGSCCLDGCRRALEDAGACFRVVLIVTAVRGRFDVISGLHRTVPTGVRTDPAMPMPERREYDASPLPSYGVCTCTSSLTMTGSPGGFPTRDADAERTRAFKPGKVSK